MMPLLLYFLKQIFQLIQNDTGPDDQFLLPYKKNQHPVINLTKAEISVTPDHKLSTSTLHPGKTN